MNNDDTISRKIVNARSVSNLTQQQVADALQVQVDKIVEIELGIRPVSTLELARLARLFRMPIASFVTGLKPATLNEECGELSELLQQRLDAIAAGVHGSLNEEELAKLFDLAVDAYRSEKITAGKLRDVTVLLGMSVEALNPLLDRTE